MQHWISLVLIGFAWQGGRANELLMQQSGYPRAFFFRAAEGQAANTSISYEQWERTFSRLMGIEGKVLEEEVPGRSLRNIDFFTRFKEGHPEQLVLLHFNGNARDPRWESDRFFAGHWIYYNGATILNDVPAEAGESEIRVSNTDLFKLNVGRYQWDNDDIGLCMLTPEGKPDWNRCEQVQLLAVDAYRGMIRVKRGCYGTIPRAFPAGQAYAAAHVTEGPWGKKSHLMWYHNYSTHCPRDRRGFQCADVLVDHLAELFGAGGDLDRFDGIQFDVLHHRVGGSKQRGPDCNADGQADMGIFGEINTYGVGVVEFCGKLRERMGSRFLILADGHSENNQRAVGFLNGIESEGWPKLRDPQIKDWSGGLNRHFFWDRFGQAPVFNYINHKFNEATNQPGVTKRADVPFHIHRLVFAAGMFTDSAICYSYAPRNDPDGLFGIWDELRKGVDNELGWLGLPLGPARRLALEQPDVLAGKTTQIVPDRWQTQKGQRVFRMVGIPCKGPDLFVSVSAQADPRQGYPESMPRKMHVGIAPDTRQFMRADLPEGGMCIRASGQRPVEQPLDPERGASLRYLANVTMQGESHNAYFLHPPYKGGVAGYTFWQRDVTVPSQGVLEFYTGMGVKSHERSDGVDFIVKVATQGSPDFTEIFRHNQKAHIWQFHRVPLTAWQGQTITIKFHSDCGPRNNTTTDHSYWGDVWVAINGQENDLTEPVSYMTWVTQETFTSGFYFSGLRSETVDLEFVVEGAEPVHVTNVTAHAFPDVIIREFERGVVLANPSPRPFELNMHELFIRQRLRRLQATANQDTGANNGAKVGRFLTLSPQEGLFLINE